MSYGKAGAPLLHGKPSIDILEPGLPVASSVRLQNAIQWDGAQVLPKGIEDWK